MLGCLCGGGFDVLIVLTAFGTVVSGCINKIFNGKKR